MGKVLFFVLASLLLHFQYALDWLCKYKSARLVDAHLGGTLKWLLVFPPQVVKAVSAMHHPISMLGSADGLWCRMTQ